MNKAELFEKFADKQNIKPFLRKPFYSSDGYTFAGNEYIMIYTQLHFGFDVVNKEMGCIIPRSPLEKPFRVEVSEMKKAVQAHPVTILKCETCNGTGDFHCGYCDCDSTCRDCDGEGKVMNDVYFSIAGVNFDTNYIKKLADFATDLCEEYVYFETGKNNIFGLKVGDYGLVICGASGTTATCEIKTEARYER